MVRLSRLVGMCAAIAQNLSWFNPPWTPQASAPWPAPSTGLKKSWLDWQMGGGPKHCLLTHKSTLCRPKTPRSMLTNENRDENSAAASSFQFRPPDGASTCAAYIAGNRSANSSLLDILPAEQLQEWVGWQQSCVVWRENQVVQTKTHACPVLILCCCQQRTLQPVPSNSQRNS